VIIKRLTFTFLPITKGKRTRKLCPHLWFLIWHINQNQYNQKLKGLQYSYVKRTNARKRSSKNNLYFCYSCYDKCLIVYYLYSLLRLLKNKGSKFLQNYLLSCSYILRNLIFIITNKGNIENGISCEIVELTKDTNKDIA